MRRQTDRHDEAYSRFRKARGWLYTSRNMPLHYACVFVSVTVTNTTPPPLQNRARDLPNTPLATVWTVRRSNHGEGEIFRTRPDHPWGPPSLQ